MKQEKVVSTVKDANLIKKRREQMIKASISLFKEKGFHKTTTREIAQKSGFSIGTLYEYIRTKEDILFLVCDAIYEQVQNGLKEALQLKEPPVERLKNVVRAYFQIIDEMQEEVLILYQEVKSLPSDSQRYVLQKEIDMVGMLKSVIKSSAPFPISDKDVQLIANNIFVQGQMWGFRRWILRKEFSLQEYIDHQLYYLLHSLGIQA